MKKLGPAEDGDGEGCDGEDDVQNERERGHDSHAPVVCLS